MCKSCRTCFMFYCMFYFTCDRSFSVASCSDNKSIGKSYLPKLQLRRPKQSHRIQQQLRQFSATGDNIEPELTNEPRTSATQKQTELDSTHRALTSARNEFRRKTFRSQSTHSYSVIYSSACHNYMW